MKRAVTAKYIDTTVESELSFEMNDPEECPICHCAWVPNFLGAVCIEQDEYQRVEAIYSCPKCYRVSTGMYYGDIFDGFKLMKVFPQTPLSQPFSDEIKALSPEFVKIYNEALFAEGYELMELAGIGYRKAIEFLVKDYAISINPEKKEDIIKDALGHCIETYIKIPQINNWVKSAVWLGNDQTHYENKHENMGVEEIKILLTASLNYIDYTINSEKLSSELLQNAKK